MRADYECLNEECGHITEYIKPHGTEFPKKIKCEECKKKKAVRIYSMPLVSVAEGRLGNSANGYENTRTYIPSHLTPKKCVEGQVGGSYGEVTEDGT